MASQTEATVKRQQGHHAGFCLDLLWSGSLQPDTKPSVQTYSTRIIANRSFPIGASKAPAHFQGLGLSQAAGRRLRIPTTDYRFENNFMHGFLATCVASASDLPAQDPSRKKFSVNSCPPKYVLFMHLVRKHCELAAAAWPGAHITTHPRGMAQ